MRKVLVHLAVAAAVCAANSSTSSADTLTITGGSLDISGPPTSFVHTGTLELSGERGFTLDAVVNGAFGRYEPAQDCFLGCMPGSTLDLFALWGGGDVGQPQLHSKASPLRT